MSLSGQVALITGASRGIGKAIALDLAQKGARVAVNYMGNKDKAQEVVDEIIASGGEGIIVKADVSSNQEVTEMIKLIEKELGTIDILVNNAGITKDNLLMRMKEEDWDQVLNTNLKGVFNCTKAVIRSMMKQKKGKIINITSVVGLTGNAGQSNYAAAKSGVIGFTKSMALELASRGIQVNAVAPGFIATDMTDKLPQEVKEQLLVRIPLQRFGKTEDVAGVVSFLASSQADYITGQVISVDGGMVM
ncbi:MAG: 3-oxoacyl-[acyl-carrier protein] reductase [Clostridia bacterium]|jgi:3-oxoacyl-[acyl-carrier protein] reductase|nr:3-oxoacyl-[acyl-carrier protein] reductase [Clostridia bacterium]MDN5322762.1 3-oxoacyl-[acyl-carrier protein] reductase [Clostridia bacterium]